MLRKNFLSKIESPIYVERFKDKKSEPLFLCDKKENFFKRVNKRKVFLFLKVNNSTKERYKKIAVLLAVPILVVIILTGGVCISIDSCNKNGTEIFNKHKEIILIEGSSKKDLDLLLAINKPGRKQNVRFEDYICNYNNIKCNKIIVESLKRLISDAKSQGYNFKITCGYLSKEFRENEYQRVLNENLKLEFTYIVSEDIAKREVFKYYEYETGLSVNIIAENTSAENFVGTKEYIWLTNNLPKYGFIIRTPQGKELKTSMNFDPTLIRFVGQENAQKMRVLSLCLEEYRKYVGLK